jgi:hypothetical protein
VLIWYILVWLVWVVNTFALAQEPRRSQARNQDTISVSEVHDTVPVRQIEPVHVQQETIVRLAQILTPIVLAVIGLLSELARRRAGEAAIIAAHIAKQQKVGDKKTGRQLQHVVRLVNSKSDAQTERIDQLTAALEAKGKRVPSRSRISAREKARGAKATAASKAAMDSQENGSQENGP